jgi:HAD superfamily hydrolase (TIGR01509 family)
MRPPRPVRAVVFDMDGLLVDTECVYRDAMLGAAEVLGAPMPLATFLAMVGLPKPESDRIALGHFGDEGVTGRWRAEAMVRVEAALAAGVALKPGVLDLLDRLDALALPRAIATSSGPPGVRSHLGPSGILPRFHAVIARGDYPRGKPHPDPFLTAARALGVEPRDCLALEDSHNGVRAASAAGMMTVMVPDLLEATDEIAGLCVCVRASLVEVLSLIPLPGGERAGPAPR